MQLYLAPMEGITTYFYRNLCHEMYPFIDKYFTPFIVTKTKTHFNWKELKDLAPENNQGINLVPQVLTNNAEDFLVMIEALEGLGYKEINLNLGCPSLTVVNKFRGSGFLAKPQELEQFLYTTVDGIQTRNLGVSLSIKTRIGKDTTEEWERLLEIYNQFPLSELIVHPRTQKDYYKNTTHLDMYEKAVRLSKNKLCYNGNIFTVADYENFREKFPETESIMLGRGIIANPALAGEILGKCQLTLEGLREFHKRLLEIYKEIYSGDTHIIQRMKELWVYMAANFQDNEKQKKQLLKAKDVQQLQAAVNCMFRECEFHPEMGYK